ncbi:MAG: hypothetical protein JWQ08_920 [Deinococcus sp.]|nr:hypothetical protein [Deinococcus sp.]
MCLHPITSLFIHEVPMTAFFSRLFGRRVRPTPVKSTLPPITELDLLRALGCDE